jgi:RNA polymerase sigma-70 factor, ECF subfamily
MMGNERMDSEELVSRYKRLVHHIIYRMISDRDAHDDIFQEAFLNILRSLPDYRGKSQLSTWITSVTMNTCRNALRKNASRSPEMNRDLREDPDLVASDSSPELDIERSDARAILEIQLNRLPPKYKMPIVLFYIEHFSYRGIADALGIPIGTVKTNIYRGMQGLKKTLEKEHGHEL